MGKKVEQRAFHGTIDPEDLARALVLRFDSEDTRAQWMRGEDKRVVVQIRSRKVERGDPETAVTAHIAPSETGVIVALSEQKWLGMAADLAKSGIETLFKPRRLLKELDDIARNVRWLNLRNDVWRAVDEHCQSAGAGRGVGPLPSNVVCAYCGTPNDVGAHRCQACRAPLAQVQTLTCAQCGFLNKTEASFCVNCGTPLDTREMGGR